MAGDAYKSILSIASASWQRVHTAMSAVLVRDARRGTITASRAGGLPAAGGLVCYEAASALYPHSVEKVFRFFAAKSLIYWSG